MNESLTYWGIIPTDLEKGKYPTPAHSNHPVPLQGGGKSTEKHQWSSQSRSIGSVKKLRPSHRTIEYSTPTAYHYIAGMHAQPCLTLCNPWDPASLLCPWDYPSKSTRVGSRFSSRGSFQPRGWTRISCRPCVVRWILSHWTTWEAHQHIIKALFTAFSFTQDIIFGYQKITKHTKR